MEEFDENGNINQKIERHRKQSKNQENINVLFYQPY